MHFWRGRWSLTEPHTTELLADPCVNLVCERSTTRRESRAVGVWTKLWERSLEGSGEVRGVKLRAGAWRAFVDGSAHEVRDAIVPLATYFQGTDALEREVMEGSDDEGFARSLRGSRRDGGRTGSSRSRWRSSSA